MGENDGYRANARVSYLFYIHLDAMMTVILHRSLFCTDIEFSLSEDVLYGTTDPDMHVKNVNRVFDYGGVEGHVKCILFVLTL